jgi:hypothetical protein
MGTIWELEAKLQEVISLMIPEATRTGNPLLKNYANQIADITVQMKVNFLISYYVGIYDRLHYGYRGYTQGNVQSWQIDGQNEGFLD